MIRRAGHGGPVSAIADLLERLAGSPPHRLPVLMYHRIANAREPQRFSPALISATPQDFERQIQALSLRYRFLSLDELLAIRRGERAPVGRSLLLTFDEGYADFAQHAWPVLRRGGIPATVFVATAYPDAPTAFWWDELYHALQATARVDPVWTDRGVFHVRTPRDRAKSLRAVHALVRVLPHDASMRLVGELVRQLDVPLLGADVLGWPELRALAAEGVTIAAHTHTHPRLTRLSATELEQELVMCQELLRQQLGAALPALAYPGGDHDSVVVAAARRAGFELGFTTRRGVNDLRHLDWLRLDRINIGTASTAPVIRAQLAVLPPFGPDSTA